MRGCFSKESAKMGIGFGKGSACSVRFWLNPKKMYSLISCEAVSTLEAMHSNVWPNAHKKLMTFRDIQVVRGKKKKKKLVQLAMT